MKIIVSGAGAWGCALALSAARHPAGHAVTLWARDASQAERMRAERQNARYLPGLPFPPALTLASGDLAALVSAFPSPSLRVYANEDIVGVEVGGAVKNVLAIATGLCDGLALGLNARAALITRGLAEMTRLGVALGD